MEYTNINKDTNDQWNHAQSAVDKINKKARLAELEYMRELFNDRLPVGEELSNIQSYFDHIQQVIETNGQINNEQFDRERELVDPESGKTIPYRYYSPIVHHERALEGGRDKLDGANQGEYKQITSESDVDHTTSSGGCDDVQDQPQESTHIPHVAKRSSRLDSIYEELGLTDTCDDNDDSSGQLGCCRTG